MRLLHFLLALYAAIFFLPPFISSERPSPSCYDDYHNATLASGGQGGDGDRAESAHILSADRFGWNFFFVCALLPFFFVPVKKYISHLIHRLHERRQRATTDRPTTVHCALSRLSLNRTSFVFLPALKLFELTT